MRTRTVKPSFFIDEELAACGPYAMLLFEGLWGAADRAGRLEDRPVRLKVQILPYFDVDVDELLGQLEAHGFISRYEVEDQRYIQVIKFNKHQNPHPKEPESIIPPLPLLLPCNYTASSGLAVEKNGKKFLGVQGEVTEVVVDPEIFSSEGDARGNQNGDCASPTHLQLEIQSQESDKLTPENLMEAWNRLVAPAGMPRVQSVFGTRRKRVLARIAESQARARHGGESAEDFWSYVFTTISETPFLLGKRPSANHSHFRATFDWVTENDTNALKIREGNYDR